MKKPKCTGTQRFWNRRDFLASMGGGLGLLALNQLLHADALRSSDGLHHKATAKRVLLLFMSAGVSHIDTFDRKPALQKFDGKPMPGIENEKDVFFRTPGVLMKSPFRFAQHGRSGKWVSELFPHQAKIVDDVAFVHSMVAEQNSHAPACYHFFTGQSRTGSPSLGSWISYGIGSETENLPSYVVLADRGSPPGSSANWSNGYLPARFQGTLFRGEGDPIIDLKPPSKFSAETQQATFEYLRKLNEEHLKKHPNDSELAARIAAYELAAKMQLSAPQAADLSKESAQTISNYGMDRSDRAQAGFSRLCLLGRRLLERGVRFVTIFCGGSNNVPDQNWDGHENLEKNHRRNALICDQPIAALIQDLKARGMWDDTLVIWSGEFGRTPTSEGGKGRDHNIRGFTSWLGGGGIREGISFGATDELGFRAVENPVSIADFHATILHTLGIDHKRLTFLHSGGHQRLTGVHGEVVGGLLKSPPEP